LRLEKVEIVGFKSFCDKQELTFQAGVTGIVGPNGCGKSNISDAISWVLGEQSAKSLRGAAMADVIFNGSQARQPVGMAEVSLKVTGLNGNSPDGSPECMVTRRLYRNGDSEYLMNGRVVRLRDIHELFMDTGLGSKAYSIIEQGKIGLILSTKPADRRALIEEAAGITKYKARRRQTQLKLDAAQQNLLRVNDIVHEVEKQLESLKRQAGKARRYRALREEIAALERILFARRFQELQQQAHSLAERIALEEKGEAALSLTLETEEAQLQARRTLLYDEEARLETARARLAELTLAVDRHQGKSGYCKEQIAEAFVRGEEAGRERAELEQRVGPLAAHLESRRGDSGRLQEQLQDAERDSQAADAALQAAGARQASLEAEQEEARDQQVTLLGRIAALQNARESTTGNAARAEASLAKLASELVETGKERDAVLGTKQHALARLREAEELATQGSAARERALASAEEARQRAAAHAREAEALQSERDSLAGRLSSLQEIVDTHAAFDEGVRALLAGPPGVLVLGVLADAIETESTYERAVETFLDDRLQAVLVPNVEQALSAIRYLEAGSAGRAAFLPLAGAPRASDALGLRAIAEMEPAVLGLLGDMYKVSGSHAEAIRACLPEALLVQSVEDAVAVAARNRGASCVTLAGETVFGAWVEGGRDVKGLLAPRREIREITTRQEQLQQQLALLRAREAEALAAAEAASAEARSLEERVHEIEKQLVAVRHELLSAEEEARRVDRKASVLESERGQAEDEKGAAAIRLAELEQSLAAAEQGRVGGSQRLAALQSALAAARGEAEAAQLRASEAKSLLAALRERSAALAGECERLLAEHDELLQRIAAAGQRALDSAARAEELQAERAEAERLLAEALVERDQAAGAAALHEDKLRELRNELDAREQSLKERRKERETLRDALQELSVQRARTDADLDHLQRECHQAVGVTAAEAAQALSDEEQLRDQNELLTQTAELRDRIEKMGPVNVLAVEQAQELEERHQFLTAQRQDLVDSVAELEGAIKRIDKTSRERFQEAFQVINLHFGEIFKQLFGGGTAGLSLIDEEDLLESGIDVMAQPPGKRLQNVMLLSGGEKALTAIALLFAIFQYKPSPFCILDEVDAPLDDANTGRFVRMLEGLKEKTQFVLITHSRRTMEIADQLYGVTMEEPGVSKLVCVRFS
jgi:chromosome segregation protein